MKTPESEKNVPYRKELGNGLILKTAADEADIQRVADCNDKVFGEEEGTGDMSRCLFLYHPNTRPDDLIFVEDEGTGEVVSSLCLIPWQWRYADVTLKVGEMGIVGTLEPYRRRGLIRAQVSYLKELLARGEYVLSQIQGIPYFYRQFGYEYTLPLEGGHRIESHQIPDLKEDEIPILNCRPETASDLPAVKRLYSEAAADLAIHTCRNDAIWKYLSEHTLKTETAYEGWIVQGANGETVSYFRTQKHGFGEGLNVYEVSKLSYEAALTVLRHLRKLAAEREKPYIRLNIPKNCVLTQTARYHGAHDLGTYAWQIHIPDMARFLRAIVPVLETRLAGSPFAGLTDEVKLNLYKETIALHFSNGQITKTESLGAVGGSICIPPRAAVSLVLGYRTREELSEYWPDLRMPPRESYLMDVLFPRMTSHLYTIY